jgi:hypothetical protein
MNLLPHLLPLETLREPCGAEFSPKKPLKSTVEFVAPWRPVGGLRLRDKSTTYVKVGKSFVARLCRAFSGELSHHYR